MTEAERAKELELRIFRQIPWQGFAIKIDPVKQASREGDIDVDNPDLVYELLARINGAPFDMRLEIKSLNLSKDRISDIVGCLVTDLERLRQGGMELVDKEMLH